MENLRLNVPLLRRKVPNLTSAARSVGLRPATVSNLCTGKISVGRSEVRTLVALASLAQCTLDELIIRGETVKMIESGIKTFDLFAPIAKGGTVGLVARPGMGQLVVLAELFHRLQKEGYKTILLNPKDNYPQLSDVESEVEIIVSSIAETFEKMKAIGVNHDVLFAADRSHVLTGEIYELQRNLEQENIQSVTTFLLDLKGLSVDEELPYGPLETLWQFDADLAARHRYPAVNPIYSTSSITESTHIDQTHQSIYKRAQKYLRRYREIRSLVNVKGIAGIPSSETEVYHRGERLEAYLTQPFYVAEEFTGQKGEYVSLEVTLKDVRKILDGGMDAEPVEDLQFIGKL
ncbi:hypothetical protein M3182_01280 [Mesobacillus maritimus]|uniref:hypothetical protein n=1 Tax=Mesobacillus maritimus TaxID=1643336 RepID=UPI00204079CD|nr:hypothetical protein [Mesobacillus maritimus]MCM3584372.1 hypothetical protein [Mesobacillus maritimus]